MPPIINKPKPNLTYHNYVSNPNANCDFKIELPKCFVQDLKLIELVLCPFL